MLEHSSNHSSRSNLFNLSSQSQGGAAKHKKPGYSSFVRKVKYLLQAEGDDLQQLYQKVQVIVRKYFKDNKIVQFGQMYNHIVSLKSNSKKMTQIVNLLQKKMIATQGHKEKSKKNSYSHEDRIDQFQVTTSTQKESKPSIINHRAERNASKEESMNKMEDSSGTVVNSIKYNYEIKPSFKDRQLERTPKIVQQQESLESSLNYSPDKNDKRSSSFQDYMKRNKEYNKKVRDLMMELTDIKHSMPNQEEIKAMEMEDNTNRIREELVLQLDQSREEEVREDVSQIVEQTPTKMENRTMKDASYQTEPQMVSTKSISSKQKINLVQEKKQDNASSTQTIGDSPQKIQIALHQQQHKNKQQSPQSQKDNKRVMLLNQANLITKQLQQLKQVAFMLQSQQSRQKHKQSFPSQQTIRNQSKIDELKQHESERQILQKISNTSSKMQETEGGMMPSFNQLRIDGLNRNAIQAQTIYPSSQYIDGAGSVFSFSNTDFQKHAIQNPSAFKKEGNRMDMRQGNNRLSLQSRDSKTMQNIPLQVSVVKHGFNPYFRQNNSHGAEPQSNPQIRYQQERKQMRPVSNMNNQNRVVVMNGQMNNQGSRQVSYQGNHPQQVYQQISNNSQMNQELNMHRTNQTIQPLIRQQQQQQQQQNRQPPAANSVPRVRSSSRQSERFPHLHKNDSLTPSPSQKMIRSSFTYSSPNSRQMTNSWSGQRKGINLMSPPPTMI